MKVEDITVVLRPRETWEAVDLGCSMTRRDFGQLMGLWAATVLPVWMVLGIVMHDLPVWYAFVVWWLKPLYDRVPLFFLSQAAFGVRPGFRQTWRAWPRLWLKDLFSALVLRRLSLMRSFALPVIMLEGQRGKATRARISALATDGGGSGTNVTWVFLKLEMAVWLGLLFFTAKFLPSSVSPDWQTVFESPELADTAISPVVYWWVNICYLLAITLVEPFYVGAGFGVYLNCRTRLEGWDVELTFRRLASRVRAMTAGAAMIAVAFVMSCVAANAAPSSDRKANADLEKPRIISPAKTPAARVAPKPAASASSPATRVANEKADEILKRPEFTVQTRKQKRWEWDTELEERDSSNHFFELFGVGFQSFGNFLFWALITALACVLVIYLMRNRHLLRLPQLAARSDEAIHAPRVVMGMDIGRDSLPDDIVTAARELWKTLGPREALSLLYRGTLSRLVERHRLPIRDSDTEDDCLDHVRQTGERGVTGYFARLTNAWICEAYAGISASYDEFEQLCATWPFQSEHTPARHLAGATSQIALAFSLPLLASCKGHWVEDEETLGYKGKARVDPFLAAETLLKEYGHKAARLPTIGKMPDQRDGVVITTSEAGVPEGRAKQLLSWVSGGGHLIYFVAGGMPYNDFSSSRDFTINFGTDERPDPILEKLSVKLHDRRPKIDLHSPSASERLKAKRKAKNTKSSSDKTSTKEDKTEEKKPADEETESDKKVSSKGDTTTTKTIRWNGETYSLELSDKITFTPARTLRTGEWSAGEEKSPFIASLHFGAGRVTLINHARPLRNKYLNDHDHAAWLLALVEDGDRTKKDVRFVVGMSASFWSLLKQRAWMPLLALGLVIIVWLWKNGRRFGPVMPLDLTETKHFADHISALGQFYFRLRRGDVLLKAAADSVRARFRQKFPQLTADDEGASMIARLAEKSGLAPERVTAALAAHPPGQNHQLVRLLQDLRTLRQSL